MNLTVDFFRSTEVVGRVWIQVELRSKIKPSRLARSVIKPEDYHNAKHLTEAVAVAAGALAEHLGDKHGDNLDPDEAYRLAKERLADAALKHGMFQK